MKLILLAITSLLTSWQFTKEQTDHQMPDPSAAWQQVTVPHDWAIYGPFDRANDLQNVTVWQNGETFPTVKTGRTGGLPYIGSAWYKTILPLQWELEGAYFLLFDGAMSEAEVFVNGQKVCFWPYGYNAFHCDITLEKMRLLFAFKTASRVAVGIQVRDSSAMCTSFISPMSMSLYGVHISLPLMSLSNWRASTLRHASRMPSTNTLNCAPSSFTKLQAK